MRFSIITPTYKRPQELARAVASVQAQTYKDWELIIVNDSPQDEGYAAFSAHINDSRIRYHIHRTNQGVNAARNTGLDHVSADSKWIIFLDDDDYFAPDALEIFAELITTHPSLQWFVTNRALKDGTPLTRANTSDKKYSYIWDYLILKRFRGDATHCIRTSLLHKLRFSRFIKQGEEWIFFYELALTNKMFYHDHNSTISGGYDHNGLNFRKRRLQQKLEDAGLLFTEGVQRGLWYHPTFFIYMLGRIIVTFYKAIRKKG